MDMKSSYMAVVAATFVCLFAGIEAGYRSKFVCPSSDDISPCTCKSEPFLHVKCSGVDSLEDIQETLSPQFRGSLLSLTITDANIPLLPNNALSDLSILRLRIRNGHIREVDENAFARQDGLRFLDLKNNRLFDVPAAALAKAAHLQTLSLADNFLMKVEESLFTRLHGLENLILRNNRITHVEQNAFPTELVSLVLSENHLASLNNSLHGLSKLEWLFLGNNRLSSIRNQFGGLTNLRLLNLENNMISDLGDHLKPLRNLQSLSLAFNRLHSLGDSLENLVELVNLDLSYNFLSELEDDVFSSLPKLKSLDLSYNQIFQLSPSIGYLSNLAHLNLSHNELDTLEYVDMKGLSHLKTLDISLNRLVSARGIGRHHMPHLTILSLRGNRIGSLHHSLKLLTALTELDISDNRLMILGKKQLSHNRDLEELKMGGNPWICSDALFNVLKHLETRLVRIKGKPGCYSFRSNL